jgi:hypothetical protein
MIQHPTTRQKEKWLQNNDMFVFLSSENRLLAHAYEELGSTPVSLHHRIFIEQPQPASQPGFSGVNVGCV